MFALPITDQHYCHRCYDEDLGQYILSSGDRLALSILASNSCDKRKVQRSGNTEVRSNGVSPALKQTTLQNSFQMSLRQTSMVQVKLKPQVNG